MGKPSGSTIIAKSQSSQEQIAKAFAAGGQKVMSALPPKRTFAVHQRMSAMGQKRTSTAISEERVSIRGDPEANLNLELS
jgi:hypothetical protein